jgi:hypothetical protein
MGDLVVKRTLVKSPPELWSEVSDLERLARHLGELGEIRISRLDPERTVAWEGEHTRGTVEIEASGWGTRVILTAEVEDAEGESASVARSAEAVQSERRPEPDLAAPPADSSSESERADAGASAEEPEPATVYPAAVLTEGFEDVEPAGVAPSSPPPERHETEADEGGSTGRATPEPRPSLSGFLARWLFRQRREEHAPTRRPLPAPGSYRPDPDPEPHTKAEPESQPEPAPEMRPAQEPVTPPEPEQQPAAESEPIMIAKLEAVDAAVESPSVAEPASSVDASLDAERVRAVFESALDSLGSAHHRPFSRG